MTFDDVVLGKDNIYDCFRRLLREEIDRSGISLKQATVHCRRSSGWMSQFMGKKSESITLADFFLLCEVYDIDAPWFFESYKDGLFKKEEMQ